MRMIGKLWWLAVLIGALTPGVAAAQPIPVVVDAPPVRETVDANGVDLIGGGLITNATDVSIGPAGSRGLAYTRYWSSNGWGDTISGGISGSTDNPIITVGASSDSFTLQGSTYVPDQGNGATLTNDGNGLYTYTSRGGVVARLGILPGILMYGIASNIGILSSITYPDGTVVTFAYAYNRACSYYGFCLNILRLQSASSNRGYMLKVGYASNTRGDLNSAGLWFDRTSITAINTQVDACNPGADTCSLAHSWPVAHYDGNSPTMVTEPDGRVWRYSYDSNGLLVGIRRPGASADDVTVSYDSSDRVQSITKAGNTWRYGYVDNSNAQRQTTTITNPDASYRTLVADTNISEPYSATDETGATTGYLFNLQGHLAQVTYPEGNATQVSYDTRSNVTQVTRFPKPNQNGGATITTSAGYDATCANPKTCNQPNWTRDGNGAQTDYAYDGGSGQPTVVTRPAGANGVRPQQRWSYTVSNGVTVLSGTSSCRTQGTCGGTSDEVVTTLAYGGNLLPTSVSTGAGDGSLTSTTAFGYDMIGNLTSVDGPLPGAGDTTYYRYDAARRAAGVISPDPDGTGPMKRRAVRTSYGADGQVSLVEAGTVTGVDDASWNAFSALQQVATGYDGYGRAANVTSSAGGTSYGVAQYAYDAMGRLQCTAQRMNPATFGSLPGACSLGTAGSYGPDRIGYTHYDAVGRTDYVTSAYQTSDAVTEHVSYTLDGKTATVTDANGNVTAYAYDGFDRPWRTCYRTTSVAACAGSPADYQQVTPDANGNVVSVRQRDGQVIGATYDALNRVVSKDVPNTVYWETDKGYGYDLLGHLTGAWDSNGRSLGFGYDALGRKVSQSDNWYAYGTASFQYDAAGRRTRTTWYDGFWVGYGYLTTGETSSISDSGGTALVTYAYDDLGRRTSVSRANGTVTSYGYDAASRLTSLGHDLAGTAQDLSLTFAYNPAGQIASRTSSNDAYAFAGSYNVDRAYAVNGLNQLTSAGATTLGYDGRGNLNVSGSTSYTYTSENRMAVAPGGIALAYDPLDRLFNINSEGSMNPTLTYDGADVIAEVDQNNNGALLRRYVQGPGSDEPLIWYEGSGTSDRRWLHADERGSVVAVTNDAGTAIAINTYDEYGIPGSGNIGRFQYTGQKWLPSVGMYDYKARMYSPTLGRFMHTDPIGYGDGLNWYNYVGGDPINASDPSGLGKCDNYDAATPVPQDAAAECIGDDIVVTGTRETPVAFDDPSPFAMQTYFVGPVGAAEPQNNCVADGRTRTCGPNAKQVIKDQHCLGSAIGSNLASLAFDAGGVALAVAAPEAKLAQLGVAAGGIVAGAFSGDLPGLGIGISGYHSVALDGQLLSKAGNFIVKGVGWATGLGAVANDINNIRKEYNKCSGE